MRAAIYARYSSDLQSVSSIDDQLRLCREFVAQRGWSVVQVFRDAALSGGTVFRPGYQGLLEGGRDAAFDVVVAESLDRLSRDQEDVAGLFKRLRYAGIAIVTLAEGEISELHVGLKGAMNGLFLRDLADKTRRELRGRVEAGRSGGSVSYGYRVVTGVGPDGKPNTGLREIDLAQAAVVTRVFLAYAAGESPKRIALKLNADGIAGPRGGGWSASTINGNRARGTGILNNELYVGRLVWNRLAFAKDPETGRRRSRAKADSQVVTVAVPELRIVNDELWAVRDRQAGLEHGGAATTGGRTGFWSKQRPRHIFSGLMRCGACGGGFSKISAAHFGCSTARNKGPTACTNLVTTRQDVLEETVLQGLRERLMDPAAFKAFVVAFTAEWNRLQGNTAAEQMTRTAELQRVRHQIERLVDAIADGTPAAAVRDRLGKLEQRRLALEAEASTAAAPAPRLHPNLAEVYRQKVADLIGAITGSDAAEARQLIRGLIDTITLTSVDGRQEVAIRGELATILQLAMGARTRKAALVKGRLCVSRSRWLRGQETTDS